MQIVCTPVFKDRSMLDVQCTCTINVDRKYLICISCRCTRHVANQGSKPWHGIVCKKRMAWSVLQGRGIWILRWINYSREKSCVCGKLSRITKIDVELTKEITRVRMPQYCARGWSSRMAACFLVLKNWLYFAVPAPIRSQYFKGTDHTHLTLPRVNFARTWLTERRDQHSKWYSSLLANTHLI